MSVHEEGRAVWATRDRAEAAEARVKELEAENKRLRAAAPPEPLREVLDVERLARALFRVQNSTGTYFAADRRFLNAIAREYAALSEPHDKP